MESPTGDQPSEGWMFSHRCARPTIRETWYFIASRNTPFPYGAGLSPTLRSWPFSR
jgi:hypothetical protein